MGRAGGCGGEKMETTELEQQYKKIIEIKKLKKEVTYLKKMKWDGKVM